MRVGVFAGVVLPLAFILGSHWGIVGIADVWVTIYPLTTIPLYLRVFKKLELSIMTYLRALWPALSGSLLMATAIWIFKQTFPQDWSPMARLSVQVAGGGLLYVLLVTTLHREQLRGFHRAVQIMRRTVS